MDRAQKEREVGQMADVFRKAKAIIFADYRGLNVAQMTELRRRLHKAESAFKVVKNRLVKKAASGSEVSGLDAFLVGPTAVASSEKDPVLPAKVMVGFASENEAMKIKAGYMDGKVLDLATVNYLAKLPSKEVLLSRLLSSLNAPVTNFTCALAAIPRQLVTVINAIKGKKERQ